MPVLSPGDGFPALTVALPGATYLQSTGFLLDPTGHVVVSVYSSGAIGRLVPDDVVGMIDYLRERAA